jgi:putative ABC transport system substrate-binding protein
MVFNRKSKTCAERCRSIQNRKWVGLFAVVVALMMCAARAAAQQSARIPRIGILIPTSESNLSARVETFRQGLRELGYVEGKNIFIEYRYADGKLERLPDLADELVRLKVDVIVTPGGSAILAAKKASATIPMVFAGRSRSSRKWACFQPGAARREYHRT